jgi:hypothetical protein
VMAREADWHFSRFLTDDFDRAWRRCKGFKQGDPDRTAGRRQFFNLRKGRGRPPVDELRRRWLASAPEVVAELQAFEATRRANGVRLRGDGLSERAAAELIALRDWSANRTDWLRYPSNPSDPSDMDPRFLRAAGDRVRKAISGELKALLGRGNLTSRAA